ncbi:uncharacterized protein [Blastocystis hominis]|uniref:Uncharacterized protein n=1 Tax=Blastocystis hominis TaxID=12968 RepID=D8LZS3_BLAHO|nr:uncharacterized protein [Blastocystis hominis]CBK21312.2 unnamed protein product [Blastocystis hominis]|eukprot:XP_012895360.1 uncharacterized protein [Blastocystis hominis]
MQIDYHITNVDRSKPMEVNEKVEAGLECNAQIKAIDWNCDGSLLAFGGKDKAITIWNPKHTTKPEYSYSVNNTVLQIKWSPIDKNVIACTMERDTLKIWDVKNEKFSFTITLTGYPDHMCWSPDGSYITVLNDVCFVLEVTMVERHPVHGGR